MTNAGIEAYFRGQWTEAAERYLEALESAQRAGSIVPAATAAINSAEILCDQGEWDRALGLFDGAVRNYEAVGYQPGIGAANLFSAVAAMRSGRLDDAARRLDVAEALLTDLAMTEWLDDLATRRSELALLRTEHDADRSSDELLRRFDPDHPLRGRALRTKGLAECVSGSIDAGLISFAAALDLTPDSTFERALTQSAIARFATNAEQAERARSETAEIYERLGVRRPPPMTADDLLTR